jgi:predicted Zn-dependent protease
LLDELLAADPDNAAALAARGRLALEAGREGEAERDLRRAVGLAPDHRLALADLARCERLLGHDAEADALQKRCDELTKDMARLQDIIREVALRPRDASLRHEAAVICLRHGQQAEGLRWLRTALEVDPDYGPARQTLAEARARKGSP